MKFSITSLSTLTIGLAALNGSWACILQCNPSVNEKCDQTDCEEGAVCLGTFANQGCNQAGLVNPSCLGGLCDQTGATNPSCAGGKCTQINSVGPSCVGYACNQDGSTDPNCQGTQCGQAGASGVIGCNYGCDQRNPTSYTSVDCKGGNCCWDTSSDGAYPGNCVGGIGGGKSGCGPKAKSCSSVAKIKVGGIGNRKLAEDGSIGSAEANRDENGDVHVTWNIDYDVSCPDCKVAIYAADATKDDIKSNNPEGEIVSATFSTISETFDAEGIIVTEDNPLLDSINEFNGTYIVFYDASGAYYADGTFGADDEDDVDPASDTSAASYGGSMAATVLSGAGFAAAFFSM